jgi:hypothetical protein
MYSDCMTAERPPIELLPRDLQPYRRGNASDGEHEVRAPCAGCTVLMPTRQPVVGRDGVYLARPMA